MKSIDYEEIINKTSLVALASPTQIKQRLIRKQRWDNQTPDERQKVKEEWENKNKKRFKPPSIKIPKAPAINWSKAPQGYKGYNDSTYGGGLICDLIPEYELYLAVIDLDYPKKEEDIPIDDLVGICGEWILQTHTRRTPSGGYHIYFLSKTKPQMKEPSFNVDYQTNTGKQRGKYVVSNYRYTTKIKGEVIDLTKYYKKNPDVNVVDLEFEKEFYNHYKDSPQEILVVDSVDDILNKILSEVETLGLWTPPAKKTAKLVKQNKKARIKENQNELVKIIKPHVREGQRDELAKSLSGYLYKKNYTIKYSTKLFKQIFHNDEEIDHRLEFLERTYEKPKSEVAGITALRQLIGDKDIEKIKSIVENQKKPSKKEIDHSVQDIDERIGYYLEYDFNVSDKMIIQSVEKNNTLFFDSSTLNYYCKNGDNSIELIDGDFIVSHVNSLFGANEISRKQCHRALSYVTRFIKREPYALEFTNGLLCINNEDNTFQFLENVYCTSFIPKVKFPFRWNPEARGGAIEESINFILNTDEEGFEDNIKAYFKAIGHSCMGAIEKGIFTIVLGRPGTGKSTLLTILKRFLTYSEVPIPDIIKNDRFSLTPAVGKDINIDDDLQSTIWKGIGKLNTLVTGNGGSVEVKGENERLELTTYNTPKLWGASNALPPVIGDGFERRLILLQADNLIKPEKVNDSFQSDILNGKHDEGLEWLVYKSITLYIDERKKPFVTEEHKEAMLKEHNAKSDPLRTAIDYIFLYKENEDIPVKEVTREIKKWFRYAIIKGKIFEEHKTPSASQITNAMGRAGYFKGRKNIDEFDDEGVLAKRTRASVYEDIIINEKWEKEFKKFEENEKKISNFTMTQRTRN